jgi:hypothetical protein
MGTRGFGSPVCQRPTDNNERTEGVKIPTGLRGFAASTRDAVIEIRQVFGNSEFYYRDVIERCHITRKEFAKLRTDGILIKNGSRWPARWRLTQRYSSTPLEPHPSISLTEVK